MTTNVPLLTVALAGLTALLATPRLIRAQTPTGTPQAAIRQRFNPVADAFKAVNPTADEQTKFDALTTTYGSDLTTARAESDRQEMGIKMQAALTTYHTATEALLTPEQLTKFKQVYFAAGPMRNLDRRLMFTDDEKKKVEVILNDYASKAEGVKGPELRSLVDDTRAKIRAVLTTDQQTKLDAIQGLTGGDGRRASGAGAPATAPPLANPPTTPPAL